MPGQDDGIGGERAMAMAYDAAYDAAIPMDTYGSSHDILIK